MRPEHLERGFERLPDEHGIGPGRLLGLDYAPSRGGAVRAEVLAEAP